MGAIDAAITKLGANLFLATKISFANELAEICDAVRATSRPSSTGCRMTPGSVARSCAPASGSAARACPNQVSMTIRTAAQAGVDTPLLTAVDDVNHRRRTQVVERAASLLDGTVPRPPGRVAGPDLQARTPTTCAMRRH
jgi:UDPglucose 6-dehydrogenase